MEENNVLNEENVSEVIDEGQTVTTDEVLDNEMVEPEVVEAEPVEGDVVDSNPMSNMMGGLGDMMNGMMGAMNDQMIPEEPPVENNNVFLRTAVPFDLRIASKGDQKVVTLCFACSDREGKLFTLSKNYTYGNRTFLDEMPFLLPEDTFISNKLSHKAIIEYADNYVTDLDFFTTEESLESEAPIMSVNAINSKTRTMLQIDMNSDQYSAINFVNDYLMNGDINEHDLALASSVGSRVSESDVSIYKVEAIDDIVSMAKAHTDIKEKKKGFFKKKDPVEANTSIGIVLRLSRTVDGKADIIYLLTPFDIGKEYEDSKFKNATIKSIEEHYFGDSDQFVATYTVHATKITVDGADKEYMVIRGKTKDDKTKLIIFDNYMKDKLVKMIEEY